MVELEVEANDVIEINVNGQFIGGDQRETWVVAKDPSGNVIYEQDGDGNNFIYKDSDGIDKTLPSYVIDYNGYSYRLKRRGLVVIGPYLYFNYSGLTWVNLNDPNFKLTFKVRSGWNKPE